MRFDLAPDQRLLYDTTQRFLDSRAPTSVVRQWSTAPLGYDPAWWTQGAQLGWTQLLAPPSLGGGAVGDDRLVDAGLIAHAFGSNVTPGPLVTTNVCLLSADLLGTPAQQHELCPPLIAGEKHASFCFAEPASAHLDRIAATATPIAAGGFRLNGIKSPVEAAASAAQLIVAAHAPDGLMLFEIPPDAPGVRIAPLEGLDFTRRFHSVRLRDVDVAADRVLRAGDSAAVLQLRRSERVLRLAETTGCLDRVFDFTCDWTFDRYSYGRPLASYQALKHRFADMKMWLEACHATLDAAIGAVGAEDLNADLLVHVASSYIGDHATELVQECVQMHGGIGVTADHDLHLYLRRVTQNRALCGTPYAHRQCIADIVEEFV